jgi:hypothetical protein
VLKIDPRTLRITTDKKFCAALLWTSAGKQSVNYTVVLFKSSFHLTDAPQRAYRQNPLGNGFLKKVTTNRYFDFVGSFNIDYAHRKAHRGEGAIAAPP